MKVGDTVRMTEEARKSIPRSSFAKDGVTGTITSVTSTGVITVRRAGSSAKIGATYSARFFELVEELGQPYTRPMTGF